ncbi:unnamed protein product, partial [Choristocarpus tenellus]
SRLEAVRERWLERSADERRAPAKGVEERMLAYQRECEGQFVAQSVKAEVAWFREKELMALRLEMVATQRREADAYRKELQAQYDARLERVLEREREQEKRHVEQLRNSETAQFEARQNLLRDMDTLRAREQV